MSEKEQEKRSSSGSKEPINLRRAYPIAYRSILRQSIVSIIGLIMLMFIITIVDSISVGASDQAMVSQVFFVFEITLLILGIVLVIAKLIYEFVYFRLYYYGIELEHLVISRGIFFKTRSSIPLASLSDVYIDRTPIDMLFFLYNLRFTTASPAEHGPVEGLSNKNAFEFQNYLLALANTTVKPVDNEAAKETLRSSKVTRDPALFDKSPAEADPPSITPEKYPVKEEAKSPDPLTANKILEELHHTQEELKKTRDELTHTEEILEKTRETIEHPTK